MWRSKIVPVPAPHVAELINRPTKIQHGGTCDSLGAHFIHQQT